MKTFQIREEIKAKGHIGSSDADFSQLQIHHLLQLLFSHFNLLIAPCHIGIEQFSLFGQLHSLGAAYKKLYPHRCFQKLDRLAHGGLADGELLGRQRQGAAAGHMIKNLIIFQILNHRCSLPAVPAAGRTAS